MSINPLNDALTLDVHKHSDYNKCIYAKQYDTNTRQITIRLTDNNIPIVINNGEIARVRGSKPDGTYFIRDCNVFNNTITVHIKSNMLTVDGRVVCDIGLYAPANTGNPDDDQLLSSSKFYINVEKSAYSEKAVLSSNDYQTLTKLIAENRILRDELLKIKDTCEKLIIKMEQLIEIGKPNT